MTPTELQGRKAPACLFDGPKMGRFNLQEGETTPISRVISPQENPCIRPLIGVLTSFVTIVGAHLVGKILGFSAKELEILYSILVS